MSDDGAASGVPAMLLRGGTSKGLYFLLAHDLPAEVAARDAFLLRAMGSPDPRQIDGVGGADPLTSKVAVVSRSERPGVDVDYLFLQVFVDTAVVTDAQNCGNILAGVGPFAIERGLVAAAGAVTAVTIFMVNTGQIACRHRRHAGGPCDLRRQRPDRRRTGDGGGDPARVPRHRGIELRRAAADRERGRCHRMGWPAR